jgi:tRNA (guanine37-N1)-methyltransferase
VIVEVVSIFPELVDLLDVSLLGKARGSGLLDVRAHDLRDFTHDRHRTVDDTPYGGGAGMVMRPEPWGEALDAILAEGPAPLVVFLTPAGERFDQAMARRFAAEERLVFCCGRYEGIDQRVIEHTAARARVLEVSLGDFVLNGGEVAALAMIEATARLLPGVIGNPESLTEESHESGLLEYPAYTKPAEWRGLEVPPVLRSGDHGAVARWRAEQSLERTRRVRPDLLPPEA